MNQSADATDLLEKVRRGSLSPKAAAARLRAGAPRQTDTWRLPGGDPRWLSYRMAGLPVVPPAVWMSLMLGRVWSVLRESFELTDVRLEAPLPAVATQALCVEVDLRDRSVRAYQRGPDAAVRNACAARFGLLTQSTPGLAFTEPEDWFTGDELRGRAERAGLVTGSEWSTIVLFGLVDGKAAFVESSTEVPAFESPVGPETLHATLLAGTYADPDATHLYVPRTIERLRVSAPIYGEAAGLVSCRPDGEQRLLCGTLFGRAGAFIELDGVSCAKIVHDGEVFGFASSRVVSRAQRDPDSAARQVRRYLCAQLVVASNGALAEVVDIDRSFMDLGLNSSALLALTAQLERDLGCELYPTVFFEHETVNRLASYLVDKHPASVRSIECEETSHVDGEDPSGIARALEAASMRRESEPAGLGRRPRVAEARPLFIEGDPS